MDIVVLLLVAVFWLSMAGMALGCARLEGAKR